MDNESSSSGTRTRSRSKDTEGWLAAFTSDGTFTDESIGVTYRGRERVIPVENCGRAFSDMHRDRSGTGVHDGLMRVMDKILRDYASRHSLAAGYV